MDMKNDVNLDPGQSIDQESAACLSQISPNDEINTHRIANVKSVLVVLSARGMVYDRSGLRQKINHTYPGATVYFLSTSGSPMEATPPSFVDLIIDLTGPKQRQSLFFAKKMRKRGRVVVGRNAGFFRKGSYDHIFDEKLNARLVPKEMLEAERYVQKKVFGLAGVSFLQIGETPPDLGKTIALELPSMKRLS